MKIYWGKGRIEKGRKEENREPKRKKVEPPRQLGFSEGLRASPLCMIATCLPREFCRNREIPQQKVANGRRGIGQQSNMTSREDEVLLTRPLNEENKSLFLKSFSTKVRQYQGNWYLLQLVARIQGHGEVREQTRSRGHQLQVNRSLVETGRVGRANNDKNRD